VNARESADARCVRCRRARGVHRHRRRRCAAKWLDTAPDRQMRWCTGYIRGTYIHSHRRSLGCPPARDGVSARRVSARIAHSRQARRAPRSRGASRAAVGRRNKPGLSRAGWRTRSREISRDSRHTIVRLNFVGILLNSRLSHARTNPESYQSINHAGDDPV